MFLHCTTRRLGQIKEQKLPLEVHFNVTVLSEAAQPSLTLPVLSNKRS